MGLNEKFFKSASAVVPVGDENFDVVLYPGNGGSKTISSLGFAPDFVLIKARTLQTAAGAYDTVRGATKYLSTGNTGAEGAYGTVLNAFSSNGFTVGSNPGVNHPNNTFVAWCWKAANSTTTISANSVGNTIASNVRANQESGFSIVQWAGTDQNATVAHGLGVKPQLILFKARGADNNWGAYNETISATKFLILNTVASAANSSTPFQDTEPTDAIMTLGTSGSFNRSGTGGMIAYCFASISGYQLVGSYTGISSGNVVVTCGFKPRFIMLKNTDGSGNWEIYLYGD